MKTCFADTSYWIALNTPGDSLHVAARKITEIILPARIVTSEFVLIEWLDGAANARTSLRSAVLSFIESMYRDPMILIETMSSESFAAARELFGQRQDKHWSVTDCASIQICYKYSITDVLTHDHHFSQAGFRAMLRESD